MITLLIIVLRVRSLRGLNAFMAWRSLAWHKVSAHRNDGLSQPPGPAGLSQPPGPCWPVPVSPAVFGMVLLSAGGHRTAPSAPSSRRASGWLLGSRGAELTLHSSLPQNAAQIPQGPHPFPQHLFMCWVLSVSAPPATPPHCYPWADGHC